ncbi:MAG: hypothetical protein ACXAD7_07360 [Candidatus Kariarchaeaceae archaeon]|jgi:cytochrome c oxidase subunit 2
MSLQPPSPGWASKALGKDERIWSMLIILMVLMMGVITVGWVFTGDQNPPEEYVKYDSPEAMRRAFVAGNVLADLTKVTLENDAEVEAYSKLEAGDVYMLASQWNWEVAHPDTPLTALQLKQGVRYRLHLGSTDLLHGFELIGEGFIVSLQIVPGYDYIFEFTPEDTGLYRIACNEYCGTGHHTMAGLLEVVA